MYYISSGSFYILKMDLFIIHTFHTLDFSSRLIKIQIFIGALA